MRIGELARLSGVNIQTVRYYERRRLMPKPPRARSNHRLYPMDAARRVRFIKRAQDLGFSLEEIRELLSLQATPGARCADVRRRAERKLRDIDTKIHTLQAMQKALSKLMTQCSGVAKVTQCPILESLDAEGDG